MPQGVVRDDGRLTQAHALKLLLRPLPWPGGFYCLSRGTKKPVHHTRPYAQMNLSIGWQVTSKGAAVRIPSPPGFTGGGLVRGTLRTGAIQLLDQLLAGLVSL